MIPKSKAAELQAYLQEPREMQKHLTFLAIAQRLSWLSTCDRKQVGAVITREGRCVSWGFNGAPPGMPHCQHLGDVLPCTNATHAEANALAFAARSGISTDGGTLYVTLSPCEVCARLLIAAGIVEVWFLEEYRDVKGLDILIRAGVLCNTVANLTT